jgi:hypothetical protein
MTGRKRRYQKEKNSFPIVETVSLRRKNNCREEITAAL